MTFADHIRARPPVAALFLIVAFAALRTVFASLTGFGIDESYTLGQARFLALSYFDHPPLHLWFARAAMEVFGVTWAVRLPTIALFALSSWLLYRLADRLFGAIAALWAVFTLNASLFFLASAGTWIVPDGPLIVCLLAGTVALAALFFPRDAETPDPWRAWLLAGLFFGLAGLAKYQAALVVVGLLPFLLLTPNRRFLLHPAPYAGAALALLVVSPVLVWNLTHDWASFRFQGARAGGDRLRLDAFAQMVGGQFIWLGPWIAVPLVYVLVAGARRFFEPRRLFLFCLSLPSILLFTIQSLWSGSALPHWTMAGWLFVMPLLGRWLVDHPDRRPRPETWAAWTAGLAFVLTLAAGALAATGLAQRLGLVADPTLDLLDWTELDAELMRRGAGRPDGPVVAGLTWFEAGKIDLAVGDRAAVTVISDDPRGFAFREDPRRFCGRDVLIVATETTFRRFAVRAALAAESENALQQFMLTRNGRPALGLVIAAGRDFKTPPVFAPPGAPPPTPLCR